MIAILIPAVSYILLKTASDQAVVMPRKYLLDSGIGITFIIRETAPHHADLVQHFVSCYIGIAFVPDIKAQDRVYCAICIKFFILHFGRLCV